MLGAFSDLCALETQKQDQNHVLSKCKSFPDSGLESATGPRCVIETHRASSLVEWPWLDKKEVAYHDLK